MGLGGKRIAFLVAPEGAEQIEQRRLTSWPSPRTDLRNAGAEWVDDEVVVCTAGPGPLISSRRPGDLPAFVKAFVAKF